MRTNHFFFGVLCITLILTGLWSCEKVENEFSCDPDIDQYVKNNRKSLAIMGLDELNSLDPLLQRAVFNSWDHTKKRDIWIEKLNRFQEEQPLDPAGWLHVRMLIGHITEEYFNNLKCEDEKYIKSEFALQWIQFAREVLEWDDWYIAFIVYRLYTSPEQLDDELSDLSRLNARAHINSEVGDCSCNTSADFCGLAICYGGDCNEVSGCGWLWSMICNGNCF